MMDCFLRYRCEGCRNYIFIQFTLCWYLLSPFSSSAMKMISLRQIDFRERVRPNSSPILRPFQLLASQPPQKQSHLIVVLCTTHKSLFQRRKHSRKRTQTGHVYMFNGTIIWFYTAAEWPTYLEKKKKQKNKNTVIASDLFSIFPHFSLFLYY